MANKRTTKKNVLFLFCDQLRHDCLGYAGHPLVKTPNLDRLALQSANFSNAYSPTPLCVPARHSLITGLRNGAHRHAQLQPIPGVVPETPSFMSAMMQSGYTTKAVGKTHFKGRHYGFQEIERMEECVDAISDDDYLLYLRDKGVSTRFQHGMRDLLYYQPQTLPTPLEHSPSEWIADRSIAFMRDHVRYKPDQPFLLFSSYVYPHPPFAANEPYASMYDPEDISFPVDTDRPMDHLPFGALKHRGRLDGAHADPDRMRRIMSLYLGLISHVDACIGRTLDELDGLGLSDDTVVLFSADHGEMLGDHGLSQKNVPFDPSIRVPFLVKWPGKSLDGHEDTGFASLLDVFPTLADGLDLTPQTTHDDLVGQSLMDRMSGHGGAPEDFVVDYGFRDDRWLCLRTKTFKYNYWYAEGYEELYDLGQDPNETTNLLLQQEVSEAHRQRALSMKTRLMEWERQFGFPEELEGGAFPRLSTPPRPVSEEALRYIEYNMGKWADALPSDESDRVDDQALAITKALAGEKTVNRGAISVDLWEESGRSLDDTPLAPSLRGL